MRLGSSTRQGLRSPNFAFRENRQRRNLKLRRASCSRRCPSAFAKARVVERASLARPRLSTKRKLRRTGCPRIRPDEVLESRSIGVLRPTGIALACLFLCSAPALFGMSRTLAEANRHKILLINEISEPQSLDPQIGEGQTEHEIINALMDGLVENDENDQAKVVPGLADHWDHNDDYSVWTFHIRENAKWSNGDPVTSQDFVDSYRRILTASLGAVYSDALFIMKGAKDYYDQKLTDFNQVGVHAEDRHTLRIQLVGPTPYFLSAILHT